MQDEIALFIDFENIRYSLLNVQRREPDPQELIAVARRFGTVMVARAYADWARQPDFFKGSLTAAMIDRVDCPAKVRERFRQNQGQQGIYGNGRGGYDQRWRDANEPAGQESTGYHAYDEAEDDGAEVDEVDEQDPLNAGDEDLGADEMRGAGEDQDQDQDYEAEPESPNDERRPYGQQYGGGYQEQYQAQQGGFYTPQQPTIITQSTVDLNMLMDIIETVFDRPNINTYVLMSGDRDFTRICARLKLRLNKRVIVCGVPGTVSRDLISAAEQFIPLAYGPAGLAAGAPMSGGAPGYQRPYTPGASYTSVNQMAPVEPDEPGFIQFLDYIDRHWSWRTVGGVANFIGDPYNPKNRFRGRLTRDTARELLLTCIDQDILEDEPDGNGGHNLRLNREHPRVAEVLMELAQRAQQPPYPGYHQPAQ